MLMQGWRRLYPVWGAPGIACFAMGGIEQGPGRSEDADNQNTVLASELRMAEI